MSVVLNNCYLILRKKKLNYFYEKFTRLKRAIPQSKEKKDLKAKLMGTTGDLFNELHYVYKDKYNAKKVL